MGYFDAHLAVRLATGFRIFADAEVGLELFKSCLGGCVPDEELDRTYDALFPEPSEGSPEAPGRLIKAAVRTSYRGLIDARVAGGEGGAVAHFPAIVIDLISEDVSGSLGNRRHNYTQTVEAICIAQTKAEVRALHVLMQEMVADSTGYFTALGYAGPPQSRGSGDIRPVDAAMAGLMPNLLGMFQRYQRWTASVTRITPRIFSLRPELGGQLSLHHVDVVNGVGGFAGRANPKLPEE